MDPARLDRVPLFGELSARERADVAACLHEVTKDAGTTLASEGNFAYEVFVIEEGTAEVRKGDETVAMLGEGDIFGEIGLLMIGTRTASVVATTPVRLVALFSREFRQIERRMPSVAEKLRDTMRERMARSAG